MVDWPDDSDPGRHVGGWMSRTVWRRSKPLRLWPFPIAPGGAAGGGSGLAAAAPCDEVDVIVGRSRRWHRDDVYPAECRWWPLAATVPDRSRRSGQGEAAPVAAAVRGDQLGAYWIGPSGGIGSNFVNSQQPLWSSDSGPLRTRQPQKLVAARPTLGRHFTRRVRG
jgi:hypothetical protein